MRAGTASTAHYLAIIADLCAERDVLEADIKKMSDVLIGKQQCLSDINRTIATLEQRSDSMAHPEPANISARVDLLSLSLGDACVHVLKREGVNMTNRDIFDKLKEQKFEICSENPINNIGTCLNHRMKSRGDIARTGRHWTVVYNGRKDESPAVNGASFKDGAAAPTV